MGGLSLGDALALCVVLAERSPAQYERAAGRWISRFLEEMPYASLEEVQLVTTGGAADPAAATLWPDVSSTNFEVSRSEPRRLRPRSRQSATISGLATD